MDSITEDTLRKVGETLDTLDHAKTGGVHTVTVTLDGHSGGAFVLIETNLTDHLKFTVH